MNGWGGAWTAANPTDGASEVPHTIAPGQTFGAMPFSGNALHRAMRSGDNEVSRTISPDAQQALTADHSTVWFSVLMAPRLAGQTTGFAANSCGAIVFGDARFATGTGANGVSAPEINPGGSAVGVGFAGNGASFDDMRIQGLIYKNGKVNQSKATRQTLACGDRICMIVGKIQWAAAGHLDTLSLYDIANPNAALPAPFCTMKADLDQASFNVVAIGQGQCEFFDEIRFGSSLASVVPGATESHATPGKSVKVPAKPQPSKAPAKPVHEEPVVVPEPDRPLGLIIASA
jgi:hypothetical protein